MLGKKKKCRTFAAGLEKVVYWNRLKRKREKCLRFVKLPVRKP